MADIDIAVLAEKYGIAIDEADPRGTIARVMEAMDAAKSDADEEVAGLGKTVAELKGLVGEAVQAINDTRELGGVAGGKIEGKGELEVDPGALAAEQEKAGLDPERSRQVQDDLANAKSVPALTPFSRVAHPVYYQAPQTDEQKALQDWSDQLYIMSEVLRCDPRELGAYRDVVDSSPAVRKMLNDVPSMNWKPFGGHTKPQDKTATDALVSDSASSGGDYVPVAMSASIFEDIRLATPLAAQLMQINMPSLTYKPPYKTDTSICYLTAQATDMTPAAFDTGTPTLTAKGFGSAMEFSGEIEEDSLAPVLPIVRQTLVDIHADHLERALVNGDDGTHMDTFITGTTDTRTAWDGFRYLTYAGSLTQSLNTLNVDNLRLMRAGMGKYGVDPKQLIWVCSPKGHIKMLGLKDDQNNQAVMTMDKVGPQATILTGQLAAIDGAPLLVSSHYPEWETSAGIYGDSGGTPSPYTRSGVLCINKKMFWLGNRRPVRIEQDKFILSDYILVVAKARWAFMPAIACNSTYPCAYRGIDMATT